MTARLVITDGTTTVDLLGTDGYILNSWRPAISGYKGGGTYQSSSLSDGRRLVHSVFENVVERFDLKARNASQNILIHTTQELRRLLEKASDYWTTGWQDEPVWIEARASKETNTRYAIIQAGKIPEDDNPFSQPFLQPGCDAVMDGLTLLVERGHWLANEPGVGECVEVSGTQDWAMNYPLAYDGLTQKVTVPAAASLNNLPDNAVAGNGPITVHGWIKADGYGEDTAGRIAIKGSDAAATRGWHFFVSIGNGLIGRINCATQDALSHIGLDEFTADGEWHYVLMTYSEAGAGLPAARTIYINVDGAWVTSYSTQQVSIGNYVQDTADNMIIGNNVVANGTFDGEIGWMEVKDYILRSPAGGDFDPPARCPLPAPDAGSAFLGIYEGSGVAIDDLGPNANNGTAANDEWGDGCGVEFGRGGTSVTRTSYPLVFDGNTQKATIIDAASIRDLPDDGTHPGGVITVHGWIKANGYGEGNIGRIAVKGDPDSGVRGWHFVITSTDGLVAQVVCATTDAISQSGLDEFTADGLWHHVLMLYSETVVGGGIPQVRVIYLAIDGVWVTSYVSQQQSLGAYSSDNGDDLIVGNNSTSTGTFDGEIGWMEVISGARYYPGSGNFTPPPRCPLPAPHALSVFLGIREGAGTYIEDLSGNDNIGAAINAIWGEACEETVVDDPDCGDDEVYIANKHNMAQLTHIYYYDASAAAFSANLIAGALPFNLLPAVPADTPDDYVIFGIDTALLNSGPFCSLVFDIGAAQTGITDIVWEYWDSTGPGWAALTVQDNTDADGLMTGAAFDTTGVKSVHWVQPPLWIANALNGVTAYWVRARVNVAAGATAPTQQNRAVYTITWPYVDIAADQVEGDIAALAQTIIKNQSDRSTLILSPKLYGNRIIAALRSLDRGEDFTPYINLADEQNNAGITIGLGASATATDNVEAPTGRQTTLTNPGAAWAQAVTVEFDAATALQYQGRFHAFLRGEQTSGAIGDIQLRLSSRMGDIGGYTKLAPNVVTFGGTPIDHLILDFGTINIPPSDILDDDDNSVIDLIIEVYGNGAADCNLYDLILIPVDEWIGDYVMTNPLVATPNWGRRGTVASQAKLDIDAINNPKNTTRALLRVDPSDNVNDIYVSRATMPILQANAAQRLWFLVMIETTAAVGYNVSLHEIAASITEWSSERYLAARGNR